MLTNTQSRNCNDNQQSTEYNDYQQNTSARNTPINAKNSNNDGTGTGTIHRHRLMHNRLMPNHPGTSARHTQLTYTKVF